LVSCVIENDAIIIEEATFGMTYVMFTLWMNMQVNWYFLKVVGLHNL